MIQNLARRIRKYHSWDRHDASSPQDIESCRTQGHGRKSLNDRGSCLTRHGMVVVWGHGGEFMGKASRRKQARKASTDGALFEDPVAAAHEIRKRRRFWTLVCTPIISGALAIGAWTLLESESLTGIAALLGAGIFIIALLDKLNDEIRPSDGSQAASIDFGNNR
jgi:hypothetical protein